MAYILVCKTRLPLLITAQLNDLGLFGARLETPELGPDQRRVPTQPLSQVHQILDGVPRPELVPARRVDRAEEKHRLVTECNFDHIAHPHIGVELDIAGGEKHAQVDHLDRIVVVDELYRATRRRLVDDLAHASDLLAAHVVLERGAPQFVCITAG